MKLSPATLKQIKRFLAVGFSTALIDFTTYSTLLWIGLTISSSKACGFIVGTFFAYFANRFFTFAMQKGEPSRVLSFCIIYGVNLTVNIGVNNLAIYCFTQFLPAALTSEKLIKVLSFAAATAVSAALNFVGMKFVVFSAKPAAR